MTAAPRFTVPRDDRRECDSANFKVEDLRRSWQDRIQVMPNGCWAWTGADGGRGYGSIRRRASETHHAATKAHRAVYEVLVGPIPEGLTLDHLCHTRNPDCPGGFTCPHRRCVNPAHLEPVTGRENQLRSANAPSAINARKTHCKRGHEFTPDNIYRQPAKPNKRYCVACRKEVHWPRRQARSAARRAAA